MVITKQIQVISKGTAEHFALYVRKEDFQPETPYHKHDFIELVIVLSGRSGQIIDGRRTETTVGDVFVIPRGIFHSYCDCSDDFRIVNILYVPESLSMPVLDINLLPGFEAIWQNKMDEEQRYLAFHISEKDFPAILEMVQNLVNESRSREPGYQFNMLGGFMSLLGKLARIYSRDCSVSKHRYVNMAGVITYLNLNFRKPVTISKLCTVAGMSKASLMRNFNLATGTTPLQYQLQLRIREAVIMLRSSAKSLGEVAFEVGFSDVNYFSRQFKKITGCSPGIYRREAGKNIQMISLE